MVQYVYNGANLIAEYENGCLTCSVENLCFGIPKGLNKIAGGGNPRKEWLPSLFLSPEGAAHIQLFYRAGLTRFGSLIVHQEWPKMTIELAKLPPLMLDWIGPDYTTKEEFSLRREDVPCYPFCELKPA